MSGDNLQMASRLVEEHGFSIEIFGYQMDAGERIRRHSMAIRSSDRASAGRPSRTPESIDTVLEFRIEPTGD